MGFSFEVLWSRLLVLSAGNRSLALLGFRDG
jgi:hypothetical protein